MTIQKADFTPTEQALIQTWIDTEIPARIAAYQNSVTQLNTSLATVQGIEDIFEKIYASWANLHLNGFMTEIAGLNGDYFNPPVLESEIQTTAANPVGTRLFPASGGLSLDPLEDFDLLADPSDFDVTFGAWAGTPGGGGFAASGYNERLALVTEDDEWSKPDAGVPPPPLQDNAVIRDMWLAQEAALTTQLNALTLLDSELSVGQGGQANLANAITLASDRLAVVQGYLTDYPLMPVEGARQAEIATAIADIDARVNQIRSPGTDQEFVRTERYFWLRQRLNLSFGSLSRQQSTNRSINLLNSRILDLQSELAKYTDMGF